MPVYSYSCPDCGEFDMLRSIEDRNSAIDCPACSSVSRRVVVAPHLAVMNPSVRRAHATNERSQHAPRVSTGCDSGCKSTSIRKSRLQQTKFGKAQGAKQGARPWMLGH